jgi:hypothetical protein
MKRKKRGGTEIFGHSAAEKARGKFASAVEYMVQGESCQVAAVLLTRQGDYGADGYTGRI